MHVYTHEHLNASTMWMHYVHPQSQTQTQLQTWPTTISTTHTQTYSLISTHHSFLLPSSLPFCPHAPPFPTFLLTLLYFFFAIRTITFLLSYQTYSLSLSLPTRTPSLSTSPPPTRNFYHLTHTHIHARPHFLHSLKPTSWFRRCSWCRGTQTAQSPAEECCQRRNRTAGRCSSRRRGWTWGTGRSRRDTPIL